MTTTETQPEATIHKFERAGLGRAPFRFLGMTTETYQACAGAPVQPGGSCDYCGTAITNVCHVASADGRRFKVGTDCVEKVGDAGLTKAADKAKRAHGAKVRADLADRKAAALAMALADADTRARLASLTHPKMRKGATLLDWAEWMAINAGAAGRAKVLAAIKALAK